MSAIFAGGIKIIQSDAAMKETKTRVRPYPKRKAKSQSHWRRMDKKWRKKYGFKREACMYWMDTSYLLGHRGERVLVVHPSLMTQVRAAIGSANA